MPKRADVVLAQTTGILQFNGGGTQYIVQTPAGVLYIFYADTGSDLAYKKSVDGGLTWAAPVIIFAGTITQFSVWYDRWSGINADLIHLAYTESGGSDTLYRTVNAASSDALSTQTTIFAGTSAVTTGSAISICRARGGNVYCRVTIDAGAEGGFFRLPNANVPNGAWDAARTINEALATLDMFILVPGFAADNQDMMMIFWDASANQISRQIYDDSANTWAESIFSGTFTEISPATAFPNFAAAVDLTNSQIVVVAWNGIDTANADLTCWTVTESAITAKTDVVTNSTDDQGLAGITIDLQSGMWKVCYAGISSGGETWPSALNLYCKCSMDDGSTWGPETKLTTLTDNIAWLTSIPRLYLGPVVTAFHSNKALDEIMVNVEINVPKATLQIGL